MATPVQKTILMNNLSSLKDKCDANVGAPGLPINDSKRYANFSFKLGGGIQKLSAREPDTLNSAAVNSLNQAITAACNELNNGVDYDDISVLNYVDNLLENI